MLLLMSNDYKLTFFLLLCKTIANVWAIGCNEVQLRNKIAEIKVVYK